ncbi:hypothetical protein NC651_012032 [Populus alba x Populus x berolinensis]|nr:hypothetical protein NC651_012032 [Populus alba x Populus x berolinensis]
MMVIIACSNAVQVTGRVVDQEASALPKVVPWFVTYGLTHLEELKMATRKWDIGVGSCFFCFICADLGDGSIRGGMKRCDGVIGGGSKKLFLD